MHVKSIIILFVVGLFCVVTGFSCKKEEPTQPPSLPPGHTALTLRASFVSVRWCRLEWNNGPVAASFRYVLLRNNRDTVFSGMVPFQDSVKVLKDSLLTPGTAYTYTLYRILNGVRWDSASVHVRTVDITRDAYSWKTIDVPGSFIHGIWASSPRSVWICGTIGLAHIIDDSVHILDGKGIVGAPRGCYGLSDSNVWTAEENTLNRWNGHSFESYIFNGDNDSLPMMFPVQFQSVWVTADGNEVFASSTNGRIVHRRAEGKWETMQSGTTFDITRLIGFSATDVYAVATKGNYEGLVLHYDGVTWKEIAHGSIVGQGDTSSLEGSIVGIGGESPDSLYTVGRRISKRIGTRWTIADFPGNERNTGTNAFLDAVGGTWNNMWFVGDFGFVVHYNGEHWETGYPFKDFSSRKIFIGVQVFPNDVFIIGSRDPGSFIIHGR